MNSIKTSTTILLIALSVSLAAEVRLPGMVGDGMVLQRDSRVPVWGWASPGEKVILTFRNQKYRTSADNQGRWEVILPPQTAGGPHEMVITGENELKVENILFGDVWICAGQSNMVLPVERVRERYPDEVREASYPEIRHFFIPTLTSLSGPAADLPPGEWISAVPGEILRFSAAAYFFAKDLYERYRVPVGLINASVGGTPIEAWISEEGLKGFPAELETLQRNRDTAYLASVMAQRPATNQGRGTGDRGLSEDPAWYDPAYEPKGWRRINIPGYWEDQGVRDLNGVVWYRRVIDVPASMTGLTAKLFMGRIVDADYVYINGTRVGNITYQYPPRRYEIPAGVLKPGRNTVVIRVINYGGKGGFVPDKNYTLTTGQQDIDMKGDWYYKVGQVFEPVRQTGRNFSFQNQPAALYNAMIAPLAGYGIKGFIWYQGETNAGNPAPYGGLLKALITDWREKWGQGDLPFLYVQLANYMDVDYLPAESSWAELREAQLRALSLPNTAMAVAIDLGEWNDIHPLNKEDVGKRLALGAMHLAYGEKEMVWSGPLYKSHRTSGNRMILAFDHCGSGLVSSDGEKLNRFEIAGADGKYVRATAQIEGNEVIVWDEGIPHPEQVRYAWADNPAGANLYNREGLPASPFRTHDPARINDRPWRGRQCAVVLTYDDALDEHLDHAIPALDSMGFRGTFYIAGSFREFRDRVDEWSQAAAGGHELGNHTLFHPCNGRLPGRDWVNPDYDLASYSAGRMIEEVRLNNMLLSSVDGKERRSFAFTCGDMTIGGEPFIQHLRDDVAAARSTRGEMRPMGEIDLYDIGSYVISGESGDELVALAEQALGSGSLLVFLFHGVGGGHSLDVSLEAHSRLLHYLKEHELEIWTTSLIEAVDNIRIHQ